MNEIKTNHTVIFVPGLGDNVKLMKFATRGWIKYGLKPIVHSAHWANNLESFETKLTHLLNQIDVLTNSGNKVSLIGCSAGGSAVINAFANRSQAINKVIAVCARLKIGNTTGFSSFESRTAASKAFAQSVRLAEKNIEVFTPEQMKRIMTVRAKFGDELVPSGTSTIPGIYNIDIPSLEHLLSISLAITVWADKLAKFLND